MRLRKAAKNISVARGPVQSFETQYLNTNYLTFRSIFGLKLGLRNYLGDIKVFDLIFDLIDISGQIIDLKFDSF